MLMEQTSGSAGTDSGWTLPLSFSCQSDGLPGVAGQAELEEAERSGEGEAALVAVQLQRLTEKQGDDGSAE